MGACRKRSYIASAPTMTPFWKKLAEPTRMRGKDITFTLGPDAGDAAAQPANLAADQRLSTLRNLMQKRSIGGNDMLVEPLDDTFSIRFRRCAGSRQNIIAVSEPPWRRRRPDPNAAQRPDMSMGAGPVHRQTNLLERSAQSSLPHAPKPQTAHRNARRAGVKVDLPPRAKSTPTTDNRRLPGTNTQFCNYA